MRRSVTISLVVFILASCTSEPAGEFSGRLVDFEPVDEANLQVVIEITNDGTEAMKGQCTVRAEDASRSVGFDVLASTKPIQPGDTFRGNGAIRIEDEGAFRVRDVKVTNCEESSF